MAKANGLDVELVHTEPNQDAEYLKVNSLGKIPTFVGANGFVLNEAIAIAVYGTFHTTDLLSFEIFFYDIKMHF